MGCQQNIRISFITLIAIFVHCSCGCKCEKDLQKLRERVANLENDTSSGHAASHESGGADPLNLANLRGELPDPQKAQSHATTHQLNGSDALNVQGLQGTLAEPQLPEAHVHEYLNNNKIYVSEMTFVYSPPETGSPFSVPAPDISRFNPENANVSALVTVSITDYPPTFPGTPIFSYHATLQKDNSVEVRLYDLDGFEIDAFAGWDGAEVTIRSLFTAIQ